MEEDVYKRQIIDRFGKDVMMIPEDEEHFRVNVDVHVSKQFLGWVFSLGEAVKIIGPDEVVEQMRGCLLYTSQSFPRISNHP